MCKKFLILYMSELLLNTCDGDLGPKQRIFIHFKMVYYKNCACSDTVLISNAAGSQHDCS